jgi:hypothetical protein
MPPLFATGKTHCRLAYTARRVEECPETACAFWQPGGAVLEGRCAVEGVDLSGRRDLSAWLLGVREQLEGPDPEDEKEQARILFHRLLNSRE